MMEMKEMEDYKERYLELEKKNKKAEMRCLELEVEVGKLKRTNEELEKQITSIRKVVGTEEEQKGLLFDSKNEENEGDKLFELMVENKVLEYEKSKAESELDALKEKVKELASRVCELESKMDMKAMKESYVGIKDGLDLVTGETHLGTNSNLIGELKAKEESNVILAHKRTVEIGYRSRIRKRLPFEENGYPNMMAPSTPGVVQPPFSGVIDTSDENAANSNEIPKTKIECFSKNDLKHGDEEGDLDGFEGNSPITRSAKRKRASKIVTSDDENINGFKDRSPITTKTKRAFKIVTSDNETSDDDNAPICTFRTRYNPSLKADSEDEVKEDVIKPHLMRLRKSKTEDGDEKSSFDPKKNVCLQGNTSSEDEEGEDSVEKGSESEGESLGGFIVDSSDSESPSDCAFGNEDSCDESDEASDDFEETLDKIRRKRNSNFKWDLEGDMLASFGKDPELCMRAVCAIYRQQTADEKLSQGTIHSNERGFSQADATRGSKLAEFLTGGDSSGDLNKTVEELKQHDPKGIKLCTTLATKYSKQLFEIYQNKEDPYFRPL